MKKRRNKRKQNAGGSVTGRIAQIAREAEAKAVQVMRSKTGRPVGLRFLK